MDAKPTVERHVDPSRSALPEEGAARGAEVSGGTVDGVVVPTTAAVAAHTPATGTPVVEEAEKQAADLPPPLPDESHGPTATAEGTAGSSQKKNRRHRMVVGEFHQSCCPICLEKFVKENPAVIYPCSHAFHMQCAFSWRQRSASCPVCFEPLDLEMGRIADKKDIIRKSNVVIATTSNNNREGEVATEDDGCGGGINARRSSSSLYTTDNSPSPLRGGGTNSAALGEDEEGEFGGDGSPLLLNSNKNKDGKAPEHHYRHHHHSDGRNNSNSNSSRRGAGTEGTEGRQGGESHLQQQQQPPRRKGKWAKFVSCFSCCGSD